MRYLTCLLLLASSASAADVAGNWKVEFSSGVANPKIASAEFEFKVEGNKLIGKAHIGKGWPGVAPITKGTVEDNHVSFVVVGESPSSAGYPKMKFSGTIHEDEIELTMTFFYRDDESDSVQSEFKGKRMLK
jgi:opacity protein-like surface antigen